MLLIRNATLDDVLLLTELDALCWEPHLAASAELIKKRIVLFSEGQYVAVMNEDICGVLYTQRVNSTTDLLGGEFSSQHDLFMTDGPIVQLCSIAVNPRLSNNVNVGAHLRNHAIAVARRDPLTNSIIALTRCEGFHDGVNNQPPYDEYVKYVYSVRDPTIFFHVSGGAEIVKIVDSYRPEDTANLGNAVLITYPIGSVREDLDVTPLGLCGDGDVVRSPRSSKRYTETAALAADVPFTEFYSTEHPLQASVLATEIVDQVLSYHHSSLLASGINRQSLENTPFLDVIDSFQLLTLHSWLETKTDHKLAPTFLFKYSSAIQVVDYFVNCFRVPSPGTDQSRSTVSPAEEAERDHHHDGSGTAIIGLSLVLPHGIDSLSALNGIIRQQALLPNQVPITRWNNKTLDYDKYLLDNVEKVSSCKFGKFLPELELYRFPATEYGVSVAEALELDPIQRLLIRSVSKAISDSGVTLLANSDKPHNVGVFVGLSNCDYQLLESCGFKGSNSVYAATGGAASVAAGRIAHIFNFRGPAMVVDTACSSSLTAIHLATKALKRNECEYAIVAGCNVMFTEFISVAYARAGMLSPDGCCHTFDESANGYCRGEGCLAVLLKRKCDVVRPNEKVYASIKGSAVMQDGRSASLTAPNGVAQEQLLRAALKDAGVEAKDVRFVEAHGTGTKLGDPVEVGAIAAVYGRSSGRSSGDPLYVSSVKANVGHLEAAAGLVGIFSAILSLNTSAAAPNGQLHEMNDAVASIIRRDDPFLEEPIVFPRVSVPIVRVPPHRLTAAVSSFGYSGTIAHVILEEGDPVDLLTAVTGTGSRPVSCWQFCGQCKINVGMCRDLYEGEVVFRTAMNECDMAVVGFMEYSISSLLYPWLTGLLSISEAEVMLKQTCFVQPVLVALEYCCATVLWSRGKHPQYVLGHSLGEYTAAVFAGVFSIQTCMKIVVQRGRVMHGCSACIGCMVSVRTSAAKILSCLQSFKRAAEVFIAADNGPQNIVLSGEASAVKEFLIFMGDDMKHIYLPVNCAFHSPAMSSIWQEFQTAFSNADTFSALDSTTSGRSCRMISTVTGAAISNIEISDPQYWQRHITDPVRYFEAVRHCCECLHVTDFIECGPSNVLTSLGKQLHLDGCSFVADFSITSPQRNNQFFPYKQPIHRFITAKALNSGAPSGNHPCYRVDLANMRLDGIGMFQLQENMISPACAVDAMLAAHIMRDFGSQVESSLTALYSLERIRFSFCGSNVDMPSSSFDCFLVDRNMDCTDIESGYNVASATVLRSDFCAAATHCPPAGLPSQPMPSEFRGQELNRIIARVAIQQFSASAVTEHSCFRFWGEFRSHPLMCGVEPSSIFSTTVGCLDEVGRFDGHALPPPIFDLLVQACCIDSWLRYGIDDINFISNIGKILVQCSPFFLWTWTNVVPLNVNVILCRAHEVDVDNTDNLRLFECDGEVVDAATGNFIFRVSGLQFGHRSRTLMFVDNFQPVDCPTPCINNITGITKSVVCIGNQAVTESLRSQVPRLCVLQDYSPSMKRVDSMLVHVDYEQLYQLRREQVSECQSHSIAAILKSWIGQLELYCRVSDYIIISLQSMRGQDNNEATAGYLVSSIEATIKTACLEYPTVRLTIITESAARVFCSDASVIAGDMWDELLRMQSSRQTSGGCSVQYSTGHERTMRYLYCSYLPNLPISGRSIPTSTSPKLPPRGSYIIVGGLGALGLMACQVLIDLGIDKIVLVSRSGRAKAGDELLQKRLILMMSAVAVDIRIFSIDVSVEAGVEQLFLCVQSIKDWKSCPHQCNIEGVIHSAGIIRDGYIATKGAVAGLYDVWQSKAFVAYYLHKYSLLLPVPLKLFCVFSSIVAAVGNTGQAAYASANAFVESVVNERTQKSHCGIFIRWPAVAGVGMAARSKANNGVLSCQLEISDARRVLMQTISAHLTSDVVYSLPRGITVLPRNRLQITAMIAALNSGRSPLGVFDMDRVTSLFEVPCFLSTSVKGSAFSQVSEKAGGGGLLPRHIDAASISQVQDITTVVRASVQSIVCSGADADDQLPLMQQGLDSLGATELSSQLSVQFGLRLPPTMLFSCPSIDDIAAYLHLLLQKKGSTSVFRNDGNGIYLADPTTFVDHEADNNFEGANDIAVVGVSCHFPGEVNSLTELFGVLRDKSDLCTEPLGDRWDDDSRSNSINHEHDEGHTSFDSARFGGYLTQDMLENCLDGRAHGINDIELDRMDVSQRLLMRTSIDALLDYGYSVDDPSRDCMGGVFVGASGYLDTATPSSAPARLESKAPSVFDVTGNTLSVASGRISFTLGLRGPCFTTDTACSSSLVAVHAARRSLQHKECNFAIVSGVHVIQKDMSRRCAAAGMLSPDGKCHTFDEVANGYCRAEGCAAIILKRKADAVRDGDKIYASIKGSAVMQDGRSASLTAPNGVAQEQLLRAALKDAGVEAKDVRFVEAHGTGTKLGDPVEVSAIAAVYGRSSGRSSGDPLYVSSVKANVGHLEAAAGLAGLLSAILTLRSASAMPNCQLNVLNPAVAQVVHGFEIEFVEPIEFPTQLTALRRTRDGQLVGAVSSFGYSGTIAHLIVGEGSYPFVLDNEDEKQKLFKPLPAERSEAGDLTAEPAMSVMFSDTRAVPSPFEGFDENVRMIRFQQYSENDVYMAALYDCDEAAERCSGHRVTDILLLKVTTKPSNAILPTLENLIELSMLYAEAIMIRSQGYQAGEVLTGSGVDHCADFEAILCVLDGTISLEDLFCWVIGDQ
jgi:acyl transferase domain-containing protein/acyl carrier protein